MQFTEVYSEVCYICRILTITESAFSGEYPGSTFLESSQTILELDALLIVTHLKK